MKCNNTENDILNTFGDIYTPLEEAKEEIWKRCENQRLKEKVAEFIVDIPPPLNKEPRAVLDRHIISLNNEFSHFSNLATRINLKPVGLEYLNDKFCALNRDKLFLAKMPFLRKVNNNGNKAFQYKIIINFDRSEKDRISKLKTMWGENLTIFHHRMLSQHSPQIELYDASSWYKSNGGKAENYYVNFLSLFICNGVLFENFVTNSEEEKFAIRVVYPALMEVKRIFGVKPLIVPLLPHDKASDKYWYCYSEKVGKEVLRCLESCKR